MIDIIMLEKKCLIGDLLRVLNGRVELMREENYRVNIQKMYDCDEGEIGVAVKNYTVEELREKYRYYL